MTGRYGLEIRAAGTADAPGLAELFLTCGLAGDPRILAERLEAFRHGPGGVLVAVDWGPPSGVVAWRGHPTLEEDRPTARITTLLVAPDDRRRGLGRLLVKAASRSARAAGCGGLRLSAPPERPDLQAFSEATGFVRAGVEFVRPLRKARSG